MKQQKAIVRDHEAAENDTWSSGKRPFVIMEQQKTIHGVVENDRS